MKQFLISIVEKHKFFRRFALVWAIVLISLVTYVLFTNLSMVNGPVATAYGVCVGILSVVIGLYTHTRSSE